MTGDNGIYDDSSSSSDDGPPPLTLRQFEYDTSSDDEEPPSLINRHENASSSDDDSDSEPELTMPMPTRRTMARDNQAFANHVNGQYPYQTNTEQRQAERERERKKRKNKQRREKEKQKKNENKAASKIAHFIRGAILSKKFKQTRSRIIRFQALWRGNHTRQTNSSVIHKLKDFVRFYSVWGDCSKYTKEVQQELPDWAALRDKQAFVRQLDLEVDDDDEDRKETDEKLTNSMEDAMKVKERHFGDDDIEEVEGLPPVKPQKRSGVKTSTPSSPSGLGTDTAAFKDIHLSGDVVKWLKNGDPKYVEFFVRRMQQLACGDRSRILAKRLNGTTTNKVPIYETYLEQKSGFRILWTEKGDYMLIWYIAKHDRVSRLMRLIDDSKNRSERQRVSINDVDQMKSDTTDATIMDENHEIFLDPLGNVPLKVYDVDIDEIESIKKQDWTPALHLTDEERQVVETEGTVLLLGRSGTGKTICICNRMEFDRQKFSTDPLFSQLFIARSPRLCTYVEKTIGARDGSIFVTFDKLLLELEKVLPKVDGIRDSFPEDLFMKFSTFKRDVYDGSDSNNVDALIVWTNIRSFLKGSIEALQSTSNNKDFFVSKEEFLSENNFGKRRCRLETGQRELVYEVFLRYKEQLAETNAWDNCDRIVALIQRLLAAKKSHPDIFEGIQSWCKWSKIYVDEVQDYTQAEILLFFHLSGAGNLFLAGDPAQNVTKGVEFRFDDIRSVGYHVAGENRKMIPQKPQIVNVNFRSHAGILNAAASILSQMFTYFPDSAKQLGRDDGLFKGPRPGIFHKVKFETMAELLSERLSGTVVLTHDECVKEVKDKLGGYELVYGIRRAKGLEFKNIIIVDFFSSLPKISQKPWRELLLNRSVHNFKNDHPEVEGQLKLLYTGVTRCIDRLFFAETTSSLSGDAFLRFMTNTTSIQTNYVKKNSNDSLSIATKNNIENIDNLTMTKDEWLASGMTNAEAAEVEFSSDYKNAHALMEKAIYCFKQAESEEYEEKARIQSESFEFRRKLFDADRLGTFGSVSPQDYANEKEGAKILENLLKKNLLFEAKSLSKDMAKILDKLYPSSPFLDRYVLQELMVGEV